MLLFSYSTRYNSYDILLGIYKKPYINKKTKILKALGCSHGRIYLKKSLTSHLLSGLLPKKGILCRTIHLVSQLSNLASDLPKLNESVYDNLHRQYVTIHW